ncbi:hypothetical protein V1505DRAFT_358620 [Lipomyces doorenjongii]
MSSTSVPLTLAATTTAVQILVYDGKNFLIWEARVRSYLAATNVLSAIDNDITVDQMDAKALQADNVAKGIIIGHVSSLMMLTLTMFERAYDMYSYLKERYTAKAADRQARYNQLEINPPGHSYEIDS